MVMYFPPWADIIPLNVAGVRVGVTVGVAVGVGDTVLVAVLVAEGVAVGVAVLVAVGVAVGVTVGDGDTVGVGVSAVAKLVRPRRAKVRIRFFMV